ADEDGGAVPGDEARPERSVGRALVHDHGVATVERIHEARAEHVGPVELARMDDAIAFGTEVEPVARRGLAAEQRPVGVQDTLRIAARPGGVDEVGGIFRARGVSGVPAGYAGERGVQRADVDSLLPDRITRPDEE